MRVERLAAGLAAAGWVLLGAMVLGAAGEEVSPWWRLLGRLHPVVIHFPIALLMTAALFELAAMVRGRRGAPAPAAAERAVSHGSGDGETRSAETGTYATRGAAGSDSAGRDSAAARAAISPAALACLTLGAAAAVVASWFGWLNAELESHASSDAPTIFWHRWLGITVTALACVAAGAGQVSRLGWRWPRMTYRAGLLVVAGLVGFVGHLGGTLVYGSGYYTAVFESRRPRPVTTLPGPATRPQSSPAEIGGAATAPESAEGSAASGAIDFEQEILPIFLARCVECHGAEEQSARLRLDSLENALAKDEVIIPGDPEASELIIRVSLPPDDIDIMPQEGEPLSPEQIELLRRWILQLGGAEAERGADSAQPEGGRAGGGGRAEQRSEGGAGAEAADRAGEQGRIERPAAAVIVLSDEQRAVRDAAMAAIRARGGHAARIAADSEQVAVNLAVLGTYAGDSELELLVGLEPVLAWLELGGTSVTDEGLRGLTRFPRVARLGLARTAVSDAGLRHLTGLAELESLNLYATRVSDAGVGVLAGLPKLRKVFLWQTAVTPAGAQRVAAARPEIEINLGSPLPAEAPAVAADAPAKPKCCAEAQAAGRTCDHPCCVEAAAAGKVCEKCLAG